MAFDIKKKGSKENPIAGAVIPEEINDNTSQLTGAFDCSQD